MMERGMEEFTGKLLVQQEPIRLPNGGIRTLQLVVTVHGNLLTAFIADDSCAYRLSSSPIQVNRPTTKHRSHKALRAVKAAVAVCRYYNPM